MKRLLGILLCCSLFLSGCMVAPDIGTDGKSASLTYVMLVKDINNPYMQKAFSGFKEACDNIGAHAVLKGPDEATAQKQLEIIEELIDSDIDLLAVAANDKDALQPALELAMDKGIKVVSFDSAVNIKSRHLNIQQANPEIIGRVLIQSAASMLDGKSGGIAILTSTPQATNQNEWIKWMEDELTQNPLKYRRMPLIEIAYGADDPAKSAEETRRLLENENIKVIIAPTVVGLLAAAECIEEIGSEVLLTGLGLPGEMSPHILSGICPWMYMWNPIELGYLTAMGGDALVNDRINGAGGDIFTAGHLGEMVVVSDKEGGTEVMMGTPFKYDETNITEWEKVF